MFLKRQPKFLLEVSGRESQTLTRLASRCFLGLAVFVVVAMSVAAQTTSGSLSGTVKDAHGGAITGARVQVTSASRNETRTTQTGEDGRFVFPQLQPDSYTLRVESKGFKAYDLESLVLNANDKISAPDIELQVGAVTESVLVTSSGEQLQTESAERSTAITGDQIANLAINGRSYLSLTRLAPGVVNTNDYKVAGHAGLSNISVNGARGNQNNLTLDGVGNVDTGNNGDQLATVSIDAVAEFKLLSSNYQAEYGRSSGAQISVVTKSGTNEFHGSGYLYHRHDQFNANSWTNNRERQPVQLFRFNNFGYTVGGPVYLPRWGEGGPSVWNGKNKLYFFVSQEFQKQLKPQGNRNVTMPTALERTGDFSQSVDSSGNRIFIRDSTKGLTCSAANTSGCFSDGGVLNKIPQNRLYAPGLAILNVFPLPNAIGAGNGFNFRSQISDTYPRREDLVRVDYKHSDSLTLFGRYVNNQDALSSFYGSFVLGTNNPLVRINDVRPGRALAVGATKTFNSTMVNEITIGFGKNQINIDAASDALTRAKNGLSSLPMLFPNAIENDYIPQFVFGGRIGSPPTYGTNNAPFFNYNRTADIVDNFSKIVGRHALKTGVYFQHSWKDQTVFSNNNGQINFTDSNSNPLDTGFGFANAAIGVFQSFNQASGHNTGQYRYTNLEFYAQDTWKVKQRLTLDYGLRFYYIQPQYDKALQTSTFLPTLFDRSKAPRLYRPVIGTNPVTGATNTRVAFDAITNKTLPPSEIGKIVPGSGDLLNGIAKAGDKINKYLQNSPGILFSPRLGVAYDLTGKGNYVLRGGGGIFYDRFQGNETFDMLGNPPTIFTPAVNNGRLQDIAPISNVQTAVLGPSSLNAFSQDGKIPTVYQFNLGVQAKLPHDFRLDVSYVGSLSRHLLQRVNLNAIPYGTLYRRENQDASLPIYGGTVPTTEPNLAAPYVAAGLSFSGSSALPVDFLRPYQGFGNINIHQMGGNANYNSMQVSVQRRFARQLFVQANYTWSKALGVANADGDFIRIDGNTHAANYGPLSSDRRHNLAANFIYELPRASRWAGGNRVVKFFGDNWQFSGIYVWLNGAPYTPTCSITSTSQSTNLAGSATESASRCKITGDPGIGHSGDPYRQFNTSVFSVQSPGSLGLESGRNYVVGPGINNIDLSLQKSFPFGEKRHLELRVDAFNALNHTQFSGVNSNLNFAGITNLTPTNLPFDASGNFVFANRNGFGTGSGVRDPRILQMLARFVF